MARTFRRGVYLFGAALVPVAITAWFEPLALLLAAPWLLAAAWAVRRHGLPADFEAIPSSAEEARRRLAVR